MGVFSRFETKESALAEAIVSQFATGQPVWTPDNYESMAREGYRISPIVYGCVKRLSSGAAGVPRVLYRVSRGRQAKAVARHLGALPVMQRREAVKAMLRKGELTEVEDHPLLRLIARPNELYGGAQLIESLVGYRCIAGNAYTEAVGPDNRPPIELYSHRPDRTQVVVGTAREPIAGYEYRVGGAVKTIPVENMHHWKTWNPLDDWYGMPPLVAAARSTDSNNSARTWNAALTQNSARPSGLLMLKGATTRNESLIKKFLEKLKETWIGPKNAGRPGVIVSPEGVEVNWAQTAFTPVEISWMEGLQLTAREICVVFDVPSILVGDTAASTYSNYEQARKALYHEGIFPLLDLLYDDWNVWLTPKFGDDLVLGYDADGVDAVQEDQEKAHKRVREDFKANLITRNEARRALGYEDDPDGGDLYYQDLVKVGVPGDARGEDDEDEDREIAGGAKVASLVARMRAAG